MSTVPSVIFEYLVRLWWVVEVKSAKAIGYSPSVSRSTAAWKLRACRC